MLYYLSAHAIAHTDPTNANAAAQSDPVSAKIKYSMIYFSFLLTDLFILASVSNLIPSLLICSKEVNLKLFPTN
jgi:hypothetical protein